MSRLEEIEVLIGPDGRVEVKVRGVKGEGCLELTRQLERYLGGRVEHRQRTHEFLEQAREEERTDRSRTG